MREWIGFLGGRKLCGAVPLCLLALSAVACGGSSDESGGSDSALLGEAPHCTEESVLKIEGALGNGAIADTRLDNQINAGLEQFSSNEFYTPVSTLAPLATNQVALTLTWADGLFDGATSPGSGGTLTPPASHPDAGKTFCITQSKVGFVSGGDEDTAFKFAITEVQSGPATTNAAGTVTCSGMKQAVDVRGCYR